MTELLLFFGGLFIGLAIGMCVKIIIIEEENRE